MKSGFCIVHSRSELSKKRRRKKTAVKLQEIIFEAWSSANTALFRHIREMLATFFLLPFVFNKWKFFLSRELPHTSFIFISSLWCSSTLCVSASVPKGNWKIQKIFFFACLQSRCVGVEVIKFFSSFQLEFETSLKDNFCEDSQDFPSGGRSKRKSWIPNTPERQLISARFSSVVSREEKNW